jgi:TetR/AcrR family fatty acid metabolism transcriptional regulator
MDKGFYDARVEEVAELAEVGEGTIYLYFSGKQELFLAMLDQRLDLIVSGLREKSLEAGDFPERLRRITAEFFLLTMAHPHVGSDRLTLPHACEDECRERLIKAREEVSSVLAGLFRQAQVEGVLSGEMDADFAATAFLGMVHGFVFESVLSRTMFNPKEIARALVDLFLQGAISPA